MSQFLNTLSTMEAESLFAWLTVMTFILFGVVGMSWLIKYACDLYGRLATMRDHNLTKPQPIKDDGISVGQFWRRNGDKSPWPQVEDSIVEILDVKDGWVRYYMNDLFPDNRMKINMFEAIYSRYKPHYFNIKVGDQAEPFLKAVKEQDNG